VGWRWRGRGCDRATVTDVRDGHLVDAGANMAATVVPMPKSARVFKERSKPVAPSPGSSRRTLRRTGRAESPGRTVTTKKSFNADGELARHLSGDHEPSATTMKQ
jgi:hypothetical protein